MKIPILSIGFLSLGVSNRIFFQDQFNTQPVFLATYNGPYETSDDCDRTQCVDTSFGRQSNGVWKVYQGKESKTRSGRTCYPWKELRQQSDASWMSGYGWNVFEATQITEMISPYERTNYHLNGNYCRSIPEHYRQGYYGRMSEIGCFAMNSEEQLEWEECSVPSCEQYCSPYPNCEITECINYDDVAGIHYRGKLAITKSAENCFPWGEVMDSQISSDFYGRQTTSFIKRYSDYTSNLYGLEDNFCRNPDPHSRWSPWCWIYDNGKLRAEDCQIPKCSEYCSSQPYSTTSPGIQSTVITFTTTSTTSLSSTSTTPTTGTTTSRKMTTRTSTTTSKATTTTTQSSTMKPTTTSTTTTTTIRTTTTVHSNTSDISDSTTISTTTTTTLPTAVPSSAITSTSDYEDSYDEYVDSKNTSLEYDQISDQYPKSFQTNSIKPQEIKKSGKLRRAKPSLDQHRRQKMTQKLPKST